MSDFSEIMSNFVGIIVYMLQSQPIFYFVGIWLCAYILSLVINTLKRRT